MIEIDFDSRPLNIVLKCGVFSEIFDTFTQFSKEFILKNVKSCWKTMLKSVEIEMC